MVTKTRRRITVDDSELALRVGERIKAARLKAGLTQQQLAEGRYTKAYISALENGHSKPSMAALNFISGRLGVPASQFIATADQGHRRLEADLLLASGEWQRALDEYEVLLESTRDKQARAEILRSQAEALCRLGRGMEAIRPATEAWETFGELGQEAEALMAGYWLANAQYFAENIAEARSVLRTLMDKVLGGVPVDPDFRVRLLTGASYVETWDGNHQAAVAYLEEARGLASDMDDRRRASFLSAVASAYADRGDLEGAIRAGNQSLALFRSADARYVTALIENNLANNYLALGNLSKAAELVDAAHQKQEAMGEAFQIPAILDTEARIHLARGEVDEAVNLSEKAIAVAETVGNQKAVVDATVTMARAALKADRKADANVLYERAVGTLRELGPQSRLADVLTEWAELVASTGDHQRAYELTREALGTSSAH